VTGRGGLPLSALISQVLVAFTIELDNEFEQRVPKRNTPPHYPMVLHSGGH
jgi:hypothetical protein